MSFKTYLIEELKNSNNIPNRYIEDCLDRFFKNDTIAEELGANPLGVVIEYILRTYPADSYETAFDGEVEYIIELLERDNERTNQIEAKKNEVLSNK